MHGHPPFRGSGGSKPPPVNEELEALEAQKKVLDANEAEKQKKLAELQKVRTAEVLRELPCPLPNSCSACGALPITGHGLLSARLPVHTSACRSTMTMHRYKLCLPVLLNTVIHTNGMHGAGRVCGHLDVNSYAQAIDDANKETEQHASDARQLLADQKQRESTAQSV